MTTYVGIEGVSTLFIWNQSHSGKICCVATLSHLKQVGKLTASLVTRLTMTTRIGGMESASAALVIGIENANDDEIGRLVMDDSVVEAISERIHQSWMRQKIKDGFADHAWGVATRSIPPLCVRCPLPNEPRVHHTDMRPYAELTDRIKEYDRVTARAAIAGIERAGYRIVRDAEGGPS